MKAQVRRFHSPDVDDLSGWVPPCPKKFGILLQVLIGPEGQDGEESFDFVVCTPEWLREKHTNQGVIFGRHHVLVFGYHFERIQAAIIAMVENATGDDWIGLAQGISRYGCWEFEDYSD